MKSPGTGAAGIEEQHAVASVDGWPVGMTADDDVELAGLWRSAHLFDIVNKVDGNPPKPDDFGFQQSLRPRIRIVISANGNDGGDASGG